MKVNEGAGVGSGLVHSLKCMAANVPNVVHMHELLQGEKRAVFADAGYQGADKRSEVKARAPQAAWHVPMRSGRRRRLSEGDRWAALSREIEPLKAGASVYRSTGSRSCINTFSILSLSRCPVVRRLKFELAGGLYHFTLQGDGREGIYLDHTDRKVWLEVFAQACTRVKLVCHALRQMSNHYRLVIGTPEHNLVAGMRSLTGR